jgi:hypothetical protein
VLAAFYESKCWLDDLQRRAADLDVESHAIIRDIAVRLDVLNDAICQMVTDDEPPAETIWDAARTVYGPKLAAPGQRRDPGRARFVAQSDQGGNHG